MELDFSQYSVQMIIFPTYFSFMSRIKRFLHVIRILKYILLIIVNVT